MLEFFSGLWPPMPKHRGTLFAVVREEMTEHSFGCIEWVFSGLIGVYETVQRADEVVGACEQEMKDRGFDNFLFTVKVVTYYDE